MILEQKPGMQKQRSLKIEWMQLVPQNTRKDYAGPNPAYFKPKNMSYMGVAQTLVRERKIVRELDNDAIKHIKMALKFSWKEQFISMLGYKNASHFFWTEKILKDWWSI